MMFSINQIQVSIKVDKPSYFSGDTIKGIVYLKIKTPNIDGDSIQLKFVGQEKVNQLDLSNQFFKYKKIFYNNSIHLMKLDSPCNVTMIKKQFEIDIPNDIQSFCINYFRLLQCRVLYYLELFITKNNSTEIYRLEKSHRVVIHIFQQPSLNKQLPVAYQGIKTNLKKLRYFNGGNAKITLQLNKQAFKIGEDIEIIIDVDNSAAKLNLQSIQFSVQSQLVIMYPKQKRKITNYFALNNGEYITTISKGSKQLIEYKLKLEQRKEDQSTIYPQSSIRTETIIHNYNLCLFAQYESSFNSQFDNILSLAIPLWIYQNDKRPEGITSQQEKKNIENDNLIGQNNFQTIDQQNQMLQSAEFQKKYIYADHNYYGYGPQDGNIDQINIQNQQNSYQEEDLFDDIPKKHKQKKYVVRSWSEYEEFENEIDNFLSSQELINQEQKQQENIKQIKFGFSELQTIREEPNDFSNRKQLSEPQQAPIHQRQVAFQIQEYRDDLPPE